MNSRNGSSVSVRITGFGPFGPIMDNPSDIIGSNVQERIATAFPHFHTSYEKLNVSVRAVSEFFLNLEQELNTKDENDFTAKVRQSGNTADSSIILLCHFGVHSREDGGVMRLEVEGFNELDAGIPDAEGRVYSHECIDPEAGPLSFSIVSAFGEEGIAIPNEPHEHTKGKLEQIQQCIDIINKETAARLDSPLGSSEPSCLLRPTWILSRDAGRYICNYTLFRGLQVEKKYNGRVFCVFIHVCDPSKRISQEKNVQNITPKSSLENINGIVYNPSIAEQIDQSVLLVKSLLSILLPSPTEKDI